MPPDAPDPTNPPMPTTPTGTNTAGVAPELVAWVRDVTGATQITIERRSAGASRAGYAVDATTADGSVQQLWLRADTGVGPQSGGTYTVRREAAVYRALHGRGIKIAEVVAVHPTIEAFLMRRLEGRTWFSEITDPHHREAVAAEFMQQIATLHRVDVHDLDLPELGPVRALHQHIIDEIDVWDAQYRAQGVDYPLFELAFAWLRQHLPSDDDHPVVVVQGDTGPGNFMYDQHGVVAVTDWEMAHYGDFHDDLAWIYVRDVQEHFTNLTDRLQDYERFSGRRVDPARLRYFLVLAQTRCAIGTRNGLLARDNRNEMANHLIYSTLHDRLLVEALAMATGIELPVAEPLDDGRDAVGTWAFDVALADLRDHIVPNVHDGFAQRRAKGVARLLKYLREQDRLGAAADHADRRELAVLLGHDIDDVGEANSEVCRRLADSTIDHVSVLRHCALVRARATEITQGAMGALAQRHHQPLPPASG